MDAYILLVSVIIFDEVSTQSLNHLIGVKSCQDEGNIDNYLTKIKEEMRNLLKDNCTKPGFLETFTEFRDKVHPAMDLWYGNTKGGSSLVERLNECQQKCLLEPKCRSYELNKYNGVCSIQSINAYDTPLSHSTDYLFYNRNYDCGCPPVMLHSILVSYNGTKDGDEATYKRLEDGAKSTYKCVPGGWNLKI